MTNYYITYTNIYCQNHTLKGRVEDGMDEVHKTMEWLSRSLRSVGGYARVCYIGVKDNTMYISIGTGMGICDARPITPGYQEGWWEVVTPVEGETEDNHNKEGLYALLGLWERFHGAPVYRDSMKRYRGMRPERGEAFEEVDPDFMAWVVKECPQAIESF